MADEPPPQVWSRRPAIDDSRVFAWLVLGWALFVGVACALLLALLKLVFPTVLPEPPPAVSWRETPPSRTALAEPSWADSDLATIPRDAQRS